MIHDLLIKKRKIIVSATIEGISDSIDFNFILDTGATKTVIDEEVARKIGFELFRLQKGDRLMTAGGAVHSLVLREVQAKILKLPKFVYHLTCLTVFFKLWMQQAEAVPLGASTRILKMTDLKNATLASAIPTATAKYSLRAC